MGNVVNKVPPQGKGKETVPNGNMENIMGGGREICRTGLYHKLWICCRRLSCIIRKYRNKSETVNDNRVDEESAQGNGNEKEIKNKFDKCIDWLYKFVTFNSELLEELGQKELDAMKYWNAYILACAFFLAGILITMITWKNTIGSNPGMLNQAKTTTAFNRFVTTFLIVCLLLSKIPILAIFIRPYSIRTFKITRIVGILLIISAVPVLFMVARMSNLTLI